MDTLDINKKAGKDEITKYDEISSNTIKTLEILINEGYNDVLKNVTID